MMQLKKDSDGNNRSVDRSDFWRFFVKSCMYASQKVSDARRRKGELEWASYYEGRCEAARVTASLAGFSPEYLDAVHDAVEDIMKSYDGEPAQAYEFKMTVFEELYKRGLAVEVGWDFLK